MMKFSKIAGLCAVALVLSGCAILPRSGPDDGQINQAAAIKLETEEATLGYDYALVDINKTIIPFISTDDTNSCSTIGGAGATPHAIRLGVGDVIQVTIFESQAGGFSIPRDAGARPGNFVQLPPQEIGRDGQITVPYAGSLRAVGQTAAVVEGNITRRLEDRAIEPQVTVEVLEQNFPRASILGEVESPGVFTIRTSGDRILDLIAQAGGLTSDESTSFVTLSRGGNNVKVAYNALTSNSRENIYVAPGDSINISSEDKSFYVFGATGDVGKFDFGSATLDLNGAVAKASGLNDGQADPGQVLVYRMENRNALRKMGINIDSFYGYEEEIPTIYRANFRKPDSFFMAKNFEMRDGDVLYVSNSDSVELSKFFGIATTTTSGTVTIDADIDTLTE